MTFEDDLATLCSRARRQETDSAGKAAVIEALAASLGRMAAWAADGDPKVIETLLTGAENYAASEASFMASLLTMKKYREWRR